MRVLLVSANTEKINMPVLPLDLEAMKITLGIRIYPYTHLALTAIKEGIIAQDDDLLFPKFYMAPDLGEWLRSTVSDWMDGRPHWMF